MSEILGLGLIQNALLAGMLASILCGVIGTVVVAKRLVFISGGVSHAAFGGLGIAYWAGWDPRLGAAVAAVAAALLLGRETRARPHDAAIGILWAVGMAIGIVFIHRTPGYAPDLTTYLFGNILTVSRGDLMLTTLVAAIVLLTLVLLRKEIVAVAFDDAFATVQGVGVRWVSALLMVLIALSVVVLIQVVGIILVIALLTIPAVISRILVVGFDALVIVATVVGLVISLGGLAVSYQLDLPSGPTIVLLGAFLLACVEIGRRIVVNRR
ncbi:MAG: metal ABC transporter permease [Acidobacteriota bacterium]